MDSVAVKVPKPWEIEALGSEAFTLMNTKVMALSRKILSILQSTKRLAAYHVINEAYLRLR